METTASDKFENKNKMAHSRFAVSNQNDFEQLKENSKNQNTLKAAQIWLNESLAEVDDRTESQPEN